MANSGELTADLCLVSSTGSVPPLGAGSAKGLEEPVHQSGTQRVMKAMPAACRSPGGHSPPPTPFKNGHFCITPCFQEPRALGTYDGWATVRTSSPGPGGKGRVCSGLAVGRAGMGKVSPGT